MTADLPAASNHGLLCEKCQSPDLRTLETRPAASAVKRRRECETCGHRFTTLETTHGRSLLEPIEGAQ